MWCGERDSKCEEMIRRIGKMDSAAGLTKWIFLCLCLSRCAYACRILEEPTEPRIHFLNAGDSVQNSNPGLKIYCHNATSKYLIYMWMTMTMHLNISSDSRILYKGQTPDEIHQKYDKKNDQLLSLNVSDKQFQINPFRNECLGVYVDSPSESGYIITLIETCIDVWELAMGIILFRSTKNACAYYVALIYGAYISASIIYFMDIDKMTNREFLICYIFFILVISCVIYNKFLRTNAKMKQAIQWILQLVGLVLVYGSSHLHEASLCRVVLILYITFQQQYFNEETGIGKHSGCIVLLFFIFTL